MKKYLAIFILLLAFKSYGQAPVTRTKIDQNTIVKDDSGVILPYPIWQKMMQSDDYSLDRIDKTADFLLHKMTVEEKVKFLEKKKEMAARLPKPRPADAFVEGKKFDGEKITDMNGNKYDLRVANGKVYVINFWFINCPPCKKEIPELNEMVAKYKENKDVVFLAIALDDRSDLKEFIKTLPFNYNIVDDGRFYSSKYGIKGYPTHVIVGKDGLIKFSTIGLATNTVYWVDKTIAEQLKGI
jgi:thiol-disulfide isomerase/thioredoxin